MARVIDFPLGLTFHTDQQKSKFVKEFKKILRNIGVPYFDQCCDDEPTDSNSTFYATTNNVVLTKAVVQDREAVAANVTQTLTADPFSKGLLTSTSAAAVGLTLPTATALAAQIGAVRGTSFDFIVDNSVGANTVTVIVNTGITVIAGPVITGGATLTVASGTVGQFRLIFVSATAAKLARIV